MNTQEQLKQLTLLCVEDDHVIAQGLVETLSHFVKQVLWADSGSKGLELFQMYAPDIVFTDIIMANGDGISLIEAIRKTNQTVPIVAITSYKEIDGMVRLMDKKLTSFISKPFVFEDVYKILLEAAKACENFIVLAPSLVFYPKKMICIKEQKEVNLTALEQRFLMFALKSKETVMTKEMIQIYAWKDEIMSDDALKTLIKRLRVKLGISLVKAIPDIGYILQLE